MEPINEEVLANLRELQKQPFGLTLAQIREEKGLSQGALAKAAGISRPFLTQIENGKRRPSPEVAYKLVAALDMEPNVIPLLTGQLRADDLMRMQESAQVMMLLQERLAPEEWELVNTTFGGENASALMDTYNRAAFDEDPLQIKALEPIPGWSTLSPKNRKLVRQLVEQLVLAQDSREDDEDAD